MTQIRAELEADGLRRGADRAADRRRRRVHRARGVLGPARRAGRTWRRTPRAAGAAGEPAKTIGSLIDEAMDPIMDANPPLTATLPRIFNRDNVDQRRLGELMDLFNSARFTGQGASKARDLLGEVYEYFLEKFAKAEGKRGGEFYTPPSVVRVLVEVLRAHQRPGVRPVLRLGRHVRAGREVPGGPQPGAHGDLGIRPGAQRAHLADGEDEPRDPRPQRQPRLPLGRHVRPRPAPATSRGRLRDGQPAVQHQGLGAQRGGPALAVRRPAGRTTPTTPGSSTSSPSSRPVGARAW